MIKLVFIDIDNTLLSFDEYVKTTMKEGFEHFNLKPYEPYMFDIFTTENTKLWLSIEDGTLTFEELENIRWNIVFEKIGIEFDGRTFEKYFREKIYDSAILIPGAKEMLSYLNEKYILCAASNGPYNQQIHRLEISNLKKYFSYFFISQQVGFSKPAQQFFDVAFETINKDREDKILPEQTMIIGDSLTSDIKGGRNYHMKTCFFSKKQTCEQIDYQISNLIDIKKIL